MSIRRVILAVAALMALPTLASAQTSRVEGMALPGDYIKDYTGIYTYTSGVVNVGNLVYGELGNFLTNPNSGNPASFADRAVGAVLQNLFDGNLGTWAVHLREETPALGQGDNFSQPNSGAWGYDPNRNLNESFDVMWGRKFGTTSLGLRVNRSFFRGKAEPLAGAETNLEFEPAATSANLGRNIWGLGGGLGFEMNANTNVELAFLYQTRTYEVTTPFGPVPGTSTTEDDGPTTYLLAARAMYQWQPNVMLVPVVKYYSFDLSNKYDANAVGNPTPGTAATTDNSLKGWQIGTAGNWTVGNNDLFVLGVDFAHNTVDQKEGVFAIGTTDGTADETNFEVFSALETHVNNWLTVRFGARKGVWNKLKVEPTLGGNTEITSSPFTMNIGTGVKLGTLQLDAIMNDIFPQTLGGWFSNAPGGIVAFPKVSATYSF